METNWNLCALEVGETVPHVFEYDVHMKERLFGEVGPNAVVTDDRRDP